MIQEAHIFVTGSVQGVGFRSAVRKQALNHHIQGYVRNLPDGRVEICAQGEKGQILAFLKDVETCPGRGSVAHLEKVFRPVEKIFAFFEIL